MNKPLRIIEDIEPVQLNDRLGAEIHKLLSKKEFQWIETQMPRLSPIECRNAAFIYELSGWFFDHTEAEATLRLQLIESILVRENVVSSGLASGTVSSPTFAENVELLQALVIWMRGLIEADFRARANDIRMLVGDPLNSAGTTPAR